MKAFACLLRNGALNRSTMTPFSLFVLLYMTASFLELVEEWKYPEFTLAIFLVIVISIVTKITRMTFLIFLILTTMHFLLFQFPDVGNHLNIILYCNVVMIVGIAYSFFRREDVHTDDDYFAMIRPLLFATLMLVYFFAGFHKLNADFLNPEVSCVRQELDTFFIVAQLPVFGIPAALVLLAGVSVVLYQIFLLNKARLYGTVHSWIGVISIIVLIVIFVIQLPRSVLSPIETSLIRAVAIVVIIWQLIGGPLLAIQKFQAPILLFSWMMHSTLSLVGFVDFGSLALSLIFAFLPPPYFPLLNSRVNLRFLGLRVHRAYFYFAINVIGGILSGIHFYFYRFFNMWLIAGLLFYFSSLVFIWPILSVLFSPAPRPAWDSVALCSRKTPTCMFVFSLFLFLYGMTPYLGLRTTGNFSMFSNLRTEGTSSNHFLLGSNPIKIWDYQEDTVRFMRIDDAWAKAGYQYQPLRGNALPVVEFRKLIREWAEAGYTIPLTFEYQGKIYSTEDIVSDPAWRTDEWDWEMMLMDFRVIQPDGPNRCRW